jgi:hypothetical protein
MKNGFLSCVTEIPKAQDSISIREHNILSSWIEILCKRFCKHTFALDVAHRSMRLEIKKKEVFTRP